MISGHLQTPDLSDHSGDEAKLTKPSGLELKTNELWSSDLEEVGKSNNATCHI